MLSKALPIPVPSLGYTKHFLLKIDFCFSIEWLQSVPLQPPDAASWRVCVCERERDRETERECKRVCY